MATINATSNVNGRNSSTDSISLTELKTGKLLEINDGFEKMFGFTRKESIGRSSLDLGLWVNPDEREKMISLLKINGKVRNIEATGKRKNGELFTGLLSGEIVLINDETLVVLTPDCLSKFARFVEKGKTGTLRPGDEVKVGEQTYIKAVPAYNINKFREPGLP